MFFSYGSLCVRAGNRGLTVETVEKIDMKWLANGRWRPQGVLDSGVLLADYSNDLAFLELLRWKSESHRRTPWS